MINRTLINGRTWLLLNQWEDHWHFTEKCGSCGVHSSARKNVNPVATALQQAHFSAVVLDPTMQGEIVRAENFAQAVDALKAIVE